MGVEKCYDLTFLMDYCENSGIKISPIFLQRYSFGFRQKFHRIFFLQLILLHLVIPSYFVDLKMIRIFALSLSSSIDFMYVLPIPGISSRE